MENENTNISARVPCVLKRIVKESDFTHKDAYELGAKLIATGDAEETIITMNSNPDLKERIKTIEFDLANERMTKLKRELDDLKGEPNGSRKLR